MPFNSRKNKRKSDEKDDSVPDNVAPSKYSSDKNSITPLKDWRIFVPNANDPSKTVDIQLKEGVEISVPSRFLDGLRSEAVL